MRSPHLAVMAGLALLVAGGCYRTSGARQVTRSTNTLNAEEIAAANVTTAYEAIERLRPHFLRGRGASSIQDPTSTPLVYMDDVRLGSIGTLRQISALTVRQIQFITARDATTRWGTGHANGVILVLTNRG